MSTTIFSVHYLRSLFVYLVGMTPCLILLSVKSVFARYLLQSLVGKKVKILLGV